MRLNVKLLKRLQKLKLLALLLKKLHESKQRKKLLYWQSVSSKSASLLRRLPVLRSNAKFRLRKSVSKLNSSLHG